MFDRTMPARVMSTFRKGGWEAVTGGQAEVSTIFSFLIISLIPECVSEPVKA